MWRPVASGFNRASSFSRARASIVSISTQSREPRPIWMLPSDARRLFWASFHHSASQPMPQSWTKRLPAAPPRADAKLLHNKIAAALAGYRDEMLKFLKLLISIPTENPPGRGYDECAG